MKFQDIRYTVQFGIRFQKIGVLGEITSVYYSTTIVFGFEVWVREADEYLIQGAFGKILA